MITALAIALLLTLFRVAAFVAFMPLFSGQNVPNTVRIGLAVSLTAVWGVKFAPAFAVGFHLQSVDNWLLLGCLAMRETLFGAGLGWLLGMILVPIRVAGAYIVQEMGLTIASITSATEASSSNIVSQLFEVLAVLLLLSLNLHHGFLRLFDATLTAFPLGRPWMLPDNDWFIGTIVNTTSLGLALAAPVGILMFITLVVTLAVMRQTPQFNLFTFGMPLRLLVGVGGLLLFLPDLIQGMLLLFRSFLVISH